MWLGEQITARGVGNGISLIIFAGIVAGAAAAPWSQTLELGRTGALSALFIIALAVGVGRRRGGHRLHGARAAPHPGAVSQAPGRQPHVRRRGLAPAAQDQHLGRDPADLRLLAAAASRRPSPRSRAPAASPAGCSGSRPTWRTARRSTCWPISALIVFFCFFYTVDRVQSGRDGGQSEEVRRLHPRHPARQEHRRVSRLRADPADRDRRALSRRRSASCPSC